MPPRKIHGLVPQPPLRRWGAPPMLFEHDGPDDPAAVAAFRGSPRQSLRGGGGGPAPEFGEEQPRAAGVSGVPAGVFLPRPQRMPRRDDCVG
mmetsp:Transcript_28377/g.32637  ORF Transcript_28377/g.32637 Transcript_28377/m.32637 type:complete len:92 (-) Transcript_28377:257-532(-)